MGVNDISCTTHSDCMVKNVGNCCGAYPMCVNHEFQPDLNAVDAFCASSMMMAICGWSVIDACACVEGSCTDLQCSDQEGLCDTIGDFSKDEVAWVCGTEHYCNAENPCADGTFCDYTSFHAKPRNESPCGQCVSSENITRIKGQNVQGIEELSNETMIGEESFVNITLPANETEMDLELLGDTSPNSTYSDPIFDGSNSSTLGTNSVSSAEQQKMAVSLLVFTFFALIVIV